MGILSCQELVDGAGGALAVGDRFDQVTGAEGDIAAGVDARRRGGERERIDLDRSARRERHAVGLGQERQVGLLANRENAGVGREVENVIVHKLRGETAIGVEHRGDGAEGNGLEARRPLELLGSAAGNEPHALALGFLEFLVSLSGAQHGHFREVFERHDRDFGGAAADGGAR